MVDVDYYINMPQFLAENFRPIFVYTFQPSNVARTDGEYKYCFHIDGSVEYIVSGGATYKHHVWNYDGDSVKAKSWWNFCGFKILREITSFSLERRQVDDDHQLILLAPLCRYKGVAAWVADIVLDGRELERLNPVEGKFTRLMTNESDGLFVHTGLAGNFVGCSMATTDDVSLNISSRVPKLDLQLAQVRRIPSLKGEPTVAWEYHREKLGAQVPSMVSTAQPRVKHYQIVKVLDDYEPEAKPAIVAFMDPLLDGAFAPDLCQANDSRSIETRVNKVKDSTTLTPFVSKVIAEFVSLFCEGHEQQLKPVEISDVFERQSTPQQRRILAVADMTTTQDRKVDSFMKREAYQNVTDPRNISTINGVDKRDYSTFMYALAEYIKKFDWYAFGKSPLELARRVAEVCELSENGAGNTDFSRMDGRVGEVPRTLERQICMRLFHSDYHPELLELLRSQTGLRGRTRFGVTYESGDSRLSGSPETSAFNTLLSAFTAYLTFRRTKTNGRFFTPREAWVRLGVYGGDDGLTADFDAGIYTTSATMVGQVLTCEVIPRGRTGIKFLARLYGPEVWFGNCNSMCDLPRTMSKFHTTVTLPATVRDVDKLIDKTYALSLTDANTPLVGPYAKQVLKHKPKKFVFKNHGRKWQAEIDPDVQYPNVYGDWMMDVAKAALPEFSFGQFNDWINGDRTLDELMHCPQFTPPVEAKPAKGGITIVNGDVVAEEAIDDMDTSPPVKEAKAPPAARKRSRARKPKKDRVSRK